MQPTVNLAFHANVLRGSSRVPVCVGAGATANPNPDFWIVTSVSSVFSAGSSSRSHSFSLQKKTFLLSLDFSAEDVSREITSATQRQKFEEEWMKSRGWEDNRRALLQYILTHEQ